MLEKFPRAGTLQWSCAAVSPCTGADVKSQGFQTMRGTVSALQEPFPTAVGLLWCVTPNTAASEQMGKQMRAA